MIASAQKVAGLAIEPDVTTGPHCTTPFTCGFCDYCNKDKVWPEYPLGSLPRLHYRKREHFEAEGYEDMRDVPDEYLNTIQNRVKQCAVSGNIFGLIRKICGLILAPEDRRADGRGQCLGAQNS